MAILHRIEKLKIFNYRFFSSKCVDETHNLLHGRFSLGVSGSQTPQQLFADTNAVSTLPLGCPIFQIYGANTDVGKTIFSAGICKSALKKTLGVSYIKPIQTGRSSDAEKVKSWCDENSLKLECKTLFSWKTGVSPHLAANLEDIHLTDKDLMQRISDELDHQLLKASGEKIVLVETAGGVCSPTPNGTSQVDVYRSIRLPVLLIGDGKLGGISTTLSALDSLIIRGYDVVGVAIIDDFEECHTLDNASAIRLRAKELSIPVFSLPPIPINYSDSLEDWFTSTCTMFDRILERMIKFHESRVNRLKSLAKEAEKVVWWPFTQHQTPGKVAVIDSAYGDEFSVLSTNDATLKLDSMFDACASWWTQGVGHGNSKISTSLAYASSRYGHVMFPNNAHEPAVQLASLLLKGVGRGWASRVFYSDDGSTAVEVGLKMAFRKFIHDHKLSWNENLRVLAQSNCYHGDTLGAMNVAVPSVFNSKQHPWYSPKSGVFIDTPSVRCIKGKYQVQLPISWEGDKQCPPTFDKLRDAFNCNRDLEDPIATLYVSMIKETINSSASTIGALLIEPVLMGAGGMILVDPLFQRLLVRECKSRMIPVVFDEVFSGFYRLGTESAASLLDVSPDIACYAKLLTGGVIPLSTTLASEGVFQCFLGKEKEQALLHGHSFTANPIGCVAAITSLNMYATHELSLGMDKFWNDDVVKYISTLPSVERTFSIGTVFSLELSSNDRSYSSSASTGLVDYLRTEKIFARALGNVVYIMCSPFTGPGKCEKILDSIVKFLKK